MGSWRQQDAHAHDDARWQHGRHEPTLDDEPPRLNSNHSHLKQTTLPTNLISSCFDINFLLSPVLTGDKKHFLCLLSSPPHSAGLITTASTPLLTLQPFTNSFSECDAKADLNTQHTDSCGITEKPLFPTSKNQTKISTTKNQCTQIEKKQKRISLRVVQCSEKSIFAWAIIML